jgi:hypothetical protein
MTTPKPKKRKHRHRRVFSGLNKLDTCVVCNTKDDGEVVLIPVAGTQSEGICEAKQVHLKCLDGLFYYPEEGLIAMRIQKGSHD